MPPQKDHRVAPHKLIETAHDLADASGKAILRHFRRPIAIDNKAQGSAFDPVTEADRAGERAIRKRLAALHPDHGILGEELGAKIANSPYTWVIDPVDGTRAFITGMPLWGTLIGVTCDGRAELGLMDQPYTRERIWSSAGSTQWRSTDGKVRRVRTSHCPRLEDARLTTTSPDLFSKGYESEAFARLRARARLTRFGGDCYAYCLLAAGHIDVVMEAGLKPYDIVALIPIIERAGGIVTTWDGGRAEDGGRILACGDPRLHEALLRLLAKK
ncbi:MAG: histidinol-phosphatase [Hyphomicrobiaceae bacterium]